MVASYVRFGSKPVLRRHRRIGPLLEVKQTKSGAQRTLRLDVGKYSHVRDDEAKGEIAKAYIVLKPEAEGDADSILALCREHLAAYKVPRQIQFVDDLPKTSTGKVMRRELRTLDE